MPRLLLVSDTHLSPAAPHAVDQWAAVVREVDRRRPDLVVHTGDVSLDGANRAADLRYARGLLAELPVPWWAIPGNHDIGDVGATTEPVDEHRRGAYHEAFAESRWHVNYGETIFVEIGRRRGRFR